MQVGADLPLVILPAADNMVGGHDRHSVEQRRGHLEQTSQHSGISQESFLPADAKKIVR